jgi:hypothetical protein
MATSSAYPFGVPTRRDPKDRCVFLSPKVQPAPTKLPKQPKPKTVKP